MLIGIGAAVVQLPPLGFLIVFLPVVFPPLPRRRRHDVALGSSGTWLSRTCGTTHRAWLRSVRPHSRWRGALSRSPFHEGIFRLSLVGARWLLPSHFCVVLSTLVNGAQPLRGVAYFALLAEPFAIVSRSRRSTPPDAGVQRFFRYLRRPGSAVQMPPSPTGRRTTLGLGRVPGARNADGSGAGAHVIGAVATNSGHFGMFGGRGEPCHRVRSSSWP